MLPLLRKLVNLTLSIALIGLTACSSGGDQNPSTGSDGNGSGGTANTPPTANAGTDAAFQEGAVVQLSGSGDDAEGAVTFSWSQSSGPGRNPQALQ